MPGPLHGLRLLDLTRILAGPTSTQLFADLGADVIKVERPKVGDDTRRWGPPFLTDAEGRETSESAYFQAANRNKRSITVDISTAEGQALIRRLIAKSDVVMENYKVGNLAKYGLSYDDLKDEMPGLVYCSITGFGQTGPYANRAGYDLLAQALGGIMSITGEEDGEPVKVGVGIADIMAGMYAAVSILAALRHRDATGEGQYIDIALLDTQVAWLVNEGLNYLTSGEVPKRRGTAHATIVPYQAFPTADGYVIIGVGNDNQFAKFCAFAGVPELADDPRFRTNADRVVNRKELIPMLREITAKRTSEEWIEGLARIHVPCSPVNTIDRTFADPQVRARGMVMEMDHPATPGKPVRLISNPVKFSKTRVEYRHPPPLLGQHTEEVLREVLEMAPEEIARLREAGVI